jgi:isocitrate dehydrogenase
MPYTDAPDGAKITINNGKLTVPDHPIIPFIEGDGIGPTSGGPASGYSTLRSPRLWRWRRIVWHEALAGQKAFDRHKNWLPDETIEALKTAWSVSAR